MLSVRSLLAHWPWLPADVREGIRNLDQLDPYWLMESAEMLVRRTGVDLEDACELVGLDERAHQAVHAAWSLSPPMPDAFMSRPREAVANV
jgi:hypothetical protein